MNQQIEMKTTQWIVMKKKTEKECPLLSNLLVKYHFRHHLDPSQSPPTKQLLHLLWKKMRILMSPRNPRGGVKLHFRFGSHYSQKENSMRTEEMFWYSLLPLGHPKMEVSQPPSMYN